MFDQIIAKVVMGWIRTAVASTMGGLVVHGYFTSSQSEQAVGAIMTLVPLAFSAWDKYQTDAKHNAQLLAVAKGAAVSQVKGTSQ